MNLRSLRNPDLCHGRLGKNYFEGWYFKLVDAGMNHAFAFIPGVFFNTVPENSHAFIQVVDGTGITNRYNRYPVTAFSADRKTFSLSVGGGTFGRRGISFNPESDTAAVKGEVIFSNHMAWPDSLLNPGSMGFYNYIPKMQCYSQVCSMDFDLEGALEIDGKQIDFSGGKGYIEKNWGAAFPYSWVWVQCNHFAGADASFSCSLGHIPFFTGSFKGFLVGLYVGGTFYEFSTMNRSRAEVARKENDLALRFEGRRHTLQIECETDSEHFILLNGPRGDKMIPLVRENLQGRIGLELREKSGKTLFAATGRRAGVEYGGEQMMILD